MLVPMLCKFLSLPACPRPRLHCPSGLPGSSDEYVTMAGDPHMTPFPPLLCGPWSFPSCCHHWSLPSPGSLALKGSGGCALEPGRPSQWSPLLPAPDTHCSKVPPLALLSVLSFSSRWKVKARVGGSAWPQVRKAVSGRRGKELIVLILNPAFSTQLQPRSSAEHLSPPSLLFLKRAAEEHRAQDQKAKSGSRTGCFTSNPQCLHL